MPEIQREKNRFYLGDSPQEPDAEILFDESEPGVYAVTRTFVSRALRGSGIARVLLDKVVDLARAEGKNIRPVCSYAVKVMTDADEYRDVLVRQKS